MKQYAISDIHGCAKTFTALLDTVGFSTSDELFLLGDYINKGPDSKGVIDLILDLKNKGYNLHCLRGNHEEMFLEVLRNRNDSVYWSDNGQAETLQSFGVDHITHIPFNYLDFIQSLPYYLEIPGYIFVHAGLNFQYSNPLHDKQAMLWSRHWYQYINQKWLGDRIIIHGHTPTRKIIIERSITHFNVLPILNIDAGCPLNFSDFGNLCAYNLTDNQLFFQTRVD